MNRWKKYTKEIPAQIKVPFPRVRDTYSFSEEERKSKLMEEFMTWRTPEK